MPDEDRTTDVQVAPDESLTLAEQNFVERRVEGMTKAAAARAAGFSESMIQNAYRIEAKPAVRDAIGRLRQEAREHHRITRDDVIRGIQDAIGQADTASEQISGWREIGKLLGYYDQATLEVKHTHEQQTDKRDVTPEKISQMPTHRLLEIAEDDVEDADFEEMTDQYGDEDGADDGDAELDGSDSE